MFATPRPHAFVLLCHSTAVVIIVLIYHLLWSLFLGLTFFLSLSLFLSFCSLWRGVKVTNNADSERVRCGHSGMIFHSLLLLVLLLLLHSVKGSQIKKQFCPFASIITVNCPWLICVLLLRLGGDLGKCDGVDLSSFDSLVSSPVEL